MARWFRAMGSWRNDNRVYHGHAVDVARRMAELITGRQDSGS